MVTYSSLNAIMAQLKNFPFGVDTTIQLQSITTTSDNTWTLLNQHTAR